ncbi:MAG: hypothetical protein V9E94_14145 [Microthrixaceae bacterium]
MWLRRARPPRRSTSCAYAVGFEVDLEFGLRSRVGRTLEQSVAVGRPGSMLDDDAARPGARGAAPTCSPRSPIAPSTDSTPT